MANDVILYRTDDGKSAIELHLDNGTVWLTQQELAELFQTSKQNISKHIKAIFEDGELDEAVVVNYQLTTTRHGAMAGKTQSKKVAYYNLDMILAIGYRVSYIQNNFKKSKKSRITNAISICGFWRLAIVCAPLVESSLDTMLRQS